MKISMMDKTGKEVKKKELPVQFEEYVRSDIIQKVCEIIQANNRQSYGADPMAGIRSSAKLSRRRRNYKGSYGHGISRVPRKTLNRRGTQLFWVGAFAPGTVGGRKAHPPKSDKIWKKEINKKENRLAIRSAIAAAMQKSLVALRGHKIPDNYPFIIDNEFEGMTKTKEVSDALKSLGFTNELLRCEDVTLKGGKAKLRGRGTRRKVGPLLVVANDCPLINSGVNLPGVEVVKVTNLNALLLAPGCEAGRATLFSEAAIDMIAKHALYTNEVKLNVVEKKSSEKETKVVKKVEKKIVPKKIIKK